MNNAAAAVPGLLLTRNEWGAGFVLRFQRANDLAGTPSHKYIENKFRRSSLRKDGRTGVWAAFTCLGKLSEAPFQASAQITQSEIVRVGARDFSPAFEQH